MMNYIDNFLDRITMYRLLLYYLIALLGTAMLVGAFGWGSYNPVAIALSAGYLTLTCWLTNKLFARILGVPVNPESSLITGLILALIITPPPSAQGYVFLTAAAGLAMASKYLLTIRNHNLFNPAALAVLLTSLGAGESASWWVGSAVFLPGVIVGGLLIVRKTQRFQLVSSFLLGSIAMVAILAAAAGGDAIATLQRMTLNSPLFFFGAVMLTEPLTTPTRVAKQRWYGLFASVLFAPQLHILSFYSTPELALIVSNLLSYCLERKFRLLPTLLKKEAAAQNISDFIFTPHTKLSYQPGQYMEWTLPHTSPDSRGSRRYFTLASSPTEANIRIGVKFYAKSSTYKQALQTLRADSYIAASQLGGDFVLPKNTNEKLVFIAGGIGITPFRSMVKYLFDTHEARDIVLLYAARTTAEIAYRDVFTEAQKQFGMKISYIVGEHITPGIIQANVADTQNRTFYISGPHSMVTAVTAVLEESSVKRNRIKTDFFPGYM